MRDIPEEVLFDIRDSLIARMREFDCTTEEVEVIMDAENMVFHSDIPEDLKADYSNMNEIVNRLIEEA